LADKSEKRKSKPSESEIQRTRERKSYKLEFYEGDAFHFELGISQEVNGVWYKVGASASKTIQPDEPWRLVERAMREFVKNRVARELSSLTT
jgi:hypothetical protein